jgi:predicted amidohydrolase YtcJ
MRATSAETIFCGGTLWTERHGRTDATALAVAAGRIVAVGSDHDVLNLRGPDTRVIDLDGVTLLPGFVDAHAHIWKIGHLLTTLLDVRGVDSLADLAVRVRDRAAGPPAGAWLYGRGYNEARFADGRGPTRADLDGVVSDRPVVLMRTCAHIIACNSRALEVAAIGRDTAAPAGGEIDRGEDGTPTGVLRETAIGLVLRHVPQPTPDEYTDMITAAMRRQLSAGITSTSDAGVIPALADTYLRMDADRRLPARINVMALGMIDGGGPLPLPGARHVSNRLRIDTIKYFADGGLSGATAALGVPYRHADTRGVLRLEEEQLLALARQAHDGGWRIATHAIGDRAIEQVLRVYEALGTGRLRHRIEHLGLPTADQLTRAARLGVIAAPQTIFVRELGLNFRRYLPDALFAHVYPIRAMLDAGITVALSSDAPVVEDDSPLAGIQAALLRRDADGQPVAPDQAITLDEALDAYTRGGAIASGDDAERGCLRQGMLADLTLLSGDIRATAPEALTTLRVTGTWVAGQQVYAG